MSDWKDIKRVSGGNGKRLVVLANSRGLFRFVEETCFTEDGYAFWCPTHFSGFYDSADAAERDARMELSWLRDERFSR